MADEIEVISDETEDGGRKGRFKGEILGTLLKLFILAIVFAGAAYFVLERKYAIGPVLIILGLLPLVLIKFSGRPMNSVWADVAFGASVNIVLVVVILLAQISPSIGKSITELKAPILLIGIVLANALMSGIAGIVEGKVDEILRKKGIDTEKTPLNVSMGNVSGCLLGAGTILTIVWTIMNL